jgi:hypothetical protein
MTTISDLRYIDPSSRVGEMQTRTILKAINTSDPVIDWVLDLVRAHAAETRALERELAQVHLDMAE